MTTSLLPHSTAAAWQLGEEQERRNCVAHDLWQLASSTFAGEGDNNLHDVLLIGSDATATTDEASSSSLPSGWGDDQAGVPANRFVLAARSPVFCRMLFGPFCESRQDTIRLLAFDTITLQAVVEFCYTNAVQAFEQRLAATALLQSHRGSYQETITRRWVQLQLAADYLELETLQTLAIQQTRKLMTRDPGLACAVWDDAVPESELSNAAWQIIATRPYVALDTTSSATASHHTRGSGGVESLTRADRLIQLAQNPTICCGELFLFRMILRWYQHHYHKQLGNTRHHMKNKKFLRAANTNATDSLDDSEDEEDAAVIQQIRQTAQMACQHVHLENIEPRQLLNSHGPIQDCPFPIPADRIFQAVAKQALLASQNRVWSMQCRGYHFSNSSLVQDRILVEGCGIPNANGLYCRITDRLYAKRRELACGQSDAYTLSCVVVKKKKQKTKQKEQNDATVQDDAEEEEEEKEEVVECRIFKSPILTHRAIPRLRRHVTAGHSNAMMRMVDPTFQPVLQIVSLHNPTAAAAAAGTFLSASAPASSTNHHAAANRTRPASLSATVPTAVSDNTRTAPGGCWHVTVSDGTCCMTGTMADKFAMAIQNGEIAETSVIHVLQFGLYQQTNDEDDNDNQINNNHDHHRQQQKQSPCIHITKLSILATSPGHLFGRMVNDQLQQQQQQQQAANNNSSGMATTIPKEILVLSNNHLLDHQHYLDDDNEDENSGLCHQLYSCSYPVSRQAKDTKVPSTGWIVDEHGCSPSPTCTWIPARISNTNNQNNNNTNKSPSMRATSMSLLSSSSAAAAAAASSPGSTTTT